MSHGSVCKWLDLPKHNRTPAAASESLSKLIRANVPNENVEFFSQARLREDDFGRHVVPTAGIRILKEEEIEVNLTEIVGGSEDRIRIHV